MRSAIHRNTASALLLFALSSLIAVMRVSADGPRRATISRATGKISIDGSLDEPSWAEAAPIGEITQREPKPGVAASEKTEVKLLYDKQNLYVGVVCYDSEPGKIIGTQEARDAMLDSDDQIQILIDTFHDSRNAFYFATNPTRRARGRPDYRKRPGQ